MFLKFHIGIFILLIFLVSEEVLSKQKDVSQKTSSSLSQKTPEKQKEIRTH